jgi:hypothetical protein
MLLFGGQDTRSHWKTSFFVILSEMNDLNLLER